MRSTSSAKLLASSHFRFARFRMPCRTINCSWAPAGRPVSLVAGGAT
jgi:hypothetical protein